MRRRAERIAVVAGATRGLGLDIARRLASSGAIVVIADRNIAGLEAAYFDVTRAGAPACYACICDVSVESQVQRVVRDTMQRFGDLDLLINASGLRAFPDVARLSADPWQRAVSNDLAGALFFARHAISRMHAGGVILNVFACPQAGSIEAMAAYGAGSAALIELTRMAAVKASAKRIHVNAVFPWPCKNVADSNIAACEPAGGNARGGPGSVAATVVSIASTVAENGFLLQGAAFRACEHGFHRIPQSGPASGAYADDIEAAASKRPNRDAGTIHPVGARKAGAS